MNGNERHFFYFNFIVGRKWSGKIADTLEYKKKWNVIWGILKKASKLNLHANEIYFVSRLSSMTTHPHSTDCIKPLFTFSLFLF